MFTYYLKKGSGMRDRTSGEWESKAILIISTQPSVVNDHCVITFFKHSFLVRI